MKNRITQRGLMLGLGAAILAAPGVTGQTAATMEANPGQATATVAAPAPVSLPYGVQDVLKLVRAQISEDIIVNYIGGSGVAYNLGPNEIVYLRGQGVSDRVMTAMMEERKRVVAQASAQAAMQQMLSTPAPANAVSAPSYAPAAQPQAAAQAAPSTVYVVPDTQTYAYPYSYPYPYYYSAPWYYGGYYGPYWGPSISLGFRFGGGGHFYGGGHYGGGHYGGGQHYGGGYHR